MRSWWRTVCSLTIAFGSTSCTVGLPGRLQWRPLTGPLPKPGLDPSSQYFDDGEGLPGADDVVFDLGSDHDEDEASLFSLDPEHGQPPCEGALHRLTGTFAEEMSGSGGPQLGYAGPRACVLCQVTFSAQ